jgi:hypothetical protein
MKRLILILATLLLCSSAWAATKVQVMTDGKIDVDKLPTIDFSLESDPASPEDGRIWWNETTKQLKVADTLGVYEFNATTLVEWDTTPAAFTFTDVVNATTETLYTSNAITVSGINHPAAISVSGDASAKYSVNSGTATAAAGTVTSGDEVRAVVTSSTSAATAVNATVTIGGVGDAFSVTTAAGASACSGDYGEHTDGGAWGPSGVYLLSVSRVPICSGGTPDLKVFVGPIQSSGREIIPVVYANVANGDGDSDDRPGALLWAGSAFFDSNVTTIQKVSFSPGTAFTGDYVWVGLLAESSATYLKQKSGTGYYRSITAADFSVGSIPATWPTSGDTGSAAVLLSIGVSY